MEGSGIMVQGVAVLGVACQIPANICPPEIDTLPTAPLAGRGQRLTTVLKLKKG